MTDWTVFSTLLARYAKVAQVLPGDQLFRSGLDMASIAFTEFVMELEEVSGTDIDLDSLDASIETAGQLFERLTGEKPA